MTNHTIPAVEIEVQETQGGARAVLLKQEFGGNVHQVELQDLHVRWLAEKFSVDDAAGLKRALLRIESMAEHLHENIKLVHDSGHEDVTTELGQAVALVDFVEFICDGFRGTGDQETASEPACAGSPTAAADPQSAQQAA